MYKPYKNPYNSDIFKQSQFHSYTNPHPRETQGPIWGQPLSQLKQPVATPNRGYNPGGSFHNLGSSQYVPANKYTVAPGVVKGNTNASSSSGGGSGYVGPDYNALYQQQLARQNELYNQQKSYVENAYASLLGKLQEGYTYGAGEVNKGADKALQDAYVNKMLTERDLPQSLNALGITGGASESTAAGLENSYGKSRTTTEEARAQSIGQLLQQLNAAKADAESQKQGSLMQLEQQRYSGLTNIDESFANQMAALAAQNARVSAQVNKNFTANNETAGATKKQASADIKNPFYNYVYNAIQSGKPMNEIEDTMLLQGVQPEYIQKYIQSLLESFKSLGGY